MSLPSDINPQLLALSSGYNLTRSLRFRASASAYLNRTPASATNRQTWTYSAWVKLSPVPQIGGYDSQLLTTKFDGVAPYATTIGINTNYKLVFASYDGSGGSPSLNLVTTQVFRDYSAWYHIVVVADTTQATAANRAKMYVNGVQITSFSTATYPSQNYNTYVNKNEVTVIGALYYSGGGPYGYYQPFDGYTAETNLIDGQALTPSSFGSTNALTGVWQPARYTGTYGTNGFYLPFTDNSALTTASNVGLGKDFSGNANYWVTNNISITAGVTYDSMTDVPTLTSATAANFAVLNPIGVPYNTGTASGGNLNWTGASTADKGMAGTIAMSSGKWYWECVITATAAASSSYVGIVKTAGSADSNANRVYLRGDGQLYKYGSSAGPYTTFTTGDIIGVAYDYSAQTLSFYKNNTLNVTVTGINLESNLPWVGGYTTTESWSVNFGQRPFAYTPPTGFVALNTYNLPTSTIVKGNKVMDATLWTGTGATQSITNASGFKPDFVWIKSRSNALNSGLMDSVRGATKLLISNATNAEQTLTDELTSFNSNGFSLGASTNGYTNYNAYTYVAWQWLKSAAAGFDIVTFTGNGGGQTFVHNLGVAPGLMICKSYNNAENWYVYHSSIGGTGGLSLNTTAATVTSVNYWSNVTPSSSTFSVGGNFSNGYTYVNYLFAPIAGYSAFGIYTGNGSADGPFVYTGFRPRWVMVKATNAVENWPITDSARSPFNAANAFVRADETSVETTGAMIMDFNSNGFKMRNSDSKSNGSGTTYIYMAYAENPFKNSLAR